MGTHDFHSRQMLDYWAMVSGARDRVHGIRRHLRSMVAQGSTLDAIMIKESRRRGFFMVHDYWRYIDRNKNNVAITGSLALVCFGAIRRRPQNVDLITLGTIKETKVKSVIVKNWPITGQTIESSGGFLFQNPYEILLAKADAVIEGVNGTEWGFHHLDDIIESSRTLGIQF
jgi:hypothetical protein